MQNLRNFISSALALLALTSCGKPQAIASTFYPGNPILSFPNSEDRSYATVVQSNPYAQVSGVDGRTLMVSSLERGASHNQTAVDIAGNLGISGTLSSASSIAMKKDVVPYVGDPLTLIRSIRFVRFRYKAEPETSLPHVGFIAERTPIEFSGAGHNAFNINNSLAVNMAATQLLDREIFQLQKQVRELKAELNDRRFPAYDPANAVSRARQ